MRATLLPLLIEMVGAMDAKGDGGLDVSAIFREIVSRSGGERFAP
jgi:hypothetical protein